MIDFDAFFETYGKPIDQQRCDAQLLRAFNDKVPDSLIEFWSRFGFGGYANGLVWVVNPTQFKDVLAEWVSPTAKKRPAIAVIRTAFGNIIYWQGSQFTFLDVHYNRRVVAGGDVEVLFGYYLVHEKSRRSVLEEPLFKKALKARGTLRHDEMYSYGLPLAFGGDPDVKNLTKAKMREHLSILAKIHTEK